MEIILKGTAQEITEHLERWDSRRVIRNRETGQHQASRSRVTVKRVRRVRRKPRIRFA